ncbi:hypothetical protein P6439_14210 [Staphylococcus arlettae]|nr:hypothetical protein [Staphylococcus arlettae]
MTNESARNKVERNIEELKDREINLEGGYDIAIKSMSNVSVSLEGSLN